MFNAVADDTDQFNSHLQVIKVDLAKGVVLIRSTDESLDAALAQLNSEDAKTLALRAAMEKGAAAPSLKCTTPTYGDDKKGIPTNKFTGGKPIRPFLIVEFHSPTVADIQFNGDSLY